MSLIQIIVFIAIAGPIVGLLLWFLLQDAFVRVNPGEMGLVITRGKPADHGLPPGVHFALRFSRLIEIYPALELTYLTVPDEQRGLVTADNLTFVDSPLRATLGDRAMVTLQYTVRFSVTSPGLPIIHQRFGTNGIMGIIRDESRHVIIEALADESVSLADAFGPPRAALEAKISLGLAKALEECGFAMTLFNLREIDLGETGEVIQSTLRATEELALERASGAERLARAQLETQVTAQIAQNLSEPALQYLRLQVMRELIERWDGKGLLPMGPGAVYGGEQPAEQTESSEPPADGGP